VVAGAGVRAEHLDRVRAVLVADDVAGVVAALGLDLDLVDVLGPLLARELGLEPGDVLRLGLVPVAREELVDPDEHQDQEQPEEDCFLRLLQRSGAPVRCRTADCTPGAPGGPRLRHRSRPRGRRYRLRYRFLLVATGSSGVKVTTAADPNAGPMCSAHSIWPSRARTTTRAPARNRRGTRASVKRSLSFLDRPRRRTGLIRSPGRQGRTS